MLDGSSERDSDSSKAILFVVYILSGPPLLFVQWLLLLCCRSCVYCRAITHYEELRRRSLIEVSITLLKIVEKYHDILNSSQEVSGISGYFP